MSAEPIVPRPSGTVVVLRDGRAGLELLLARRSDELSFHGGAWAFPGGSVELTDAAGLEPGSLEAARRAAVRELAEEVGLTLTEQALVPFALWTTPEGRPRRFRTWFFAGHATDEPATADGCEIAACRWSTPEAALRAHVAGELVLPPPTFVTIVDLGRFSTSAEALSVLAAEQMRTFTPRPVRVPGGHCSLYEGDAGFEARDLERPGARHRLWMIESGWRYERSELS